jgi:hypothetical protein
MNTNIHNIFQNRSFSGLFKASILVFGGFFMTFQACIRPPDYPVEPQLGENVSVSNTSLIQDNRGGIPRDSAFIFIDFTDGDGDLGFAKDDNSIFVIDTRDGSRTNFAQSLPLVPEAGAANGISGQMQIRIFGSCCSGIEACLPSTTKPTDTVVYEIYVKDRAGHKSNVVKTPPLTILCQ